MEDNPKLFPINHSTGVGKSSLFYKHKNMNLESLKKFESFDLFWEELSNGYLWVAGPLIVNLFLSLICSK